MSDDENMTGMPPPLDALAALAEEVGLELRGTLAAEPLPDTDPALPARLDAWLAAGYQGDMTYLERAVELGPDLRRWKDWTRGALLFALPYHRPAGGFHGGGRVARYALGRDYHQVIGKKLERLGRRLRAHGLATRYRATVDAAPVLEREWALRAGLGWRGKNTLFLHPEHGPWMLLGELLVDVELHPWAPPPARQATCGSCTRCLEVCPTDAFPTPYQLDARRCLSYLTIENRGPIPREWREPMGDWVFGCDLCLEVCPFSPDHVDASADWGLHEALSSTTLEQLLPMEEAVFHKLFTGSPLRRPGWEGLLRNACVVLGNLQRGGDALRVAVREHPSPLVRSHAAWALGRLGDEATLREVAAKDQDESVRAEAHAAGS